MSSQLKFTNCELKLVRQRYRPYAFTEHGAIMAANSLNSPWAVQRNQIRRIACETEAHMRRLTAKSREQQAEAAKLDAATCLRRGFGRRVAANPKELGYG